MSDASYESWEYLLNSGKLFGIFEAFHCGIAIHSCDGRYLYANKAYKEMFKMTGNEPVGHHVCDYFDTGEQGMMTAIKTRKENMGITIAKDGTYGVAYRIPILNKSGELVCAVAETISVGDRDKIALLKKSIDELHKRLEYYEWNSHTHRGAQHTFSGFVGESLLMRDIKSLGQRFAQGVQPVLITGESGTGKEIVAQAIHMASPRKNKPFIAVNCAALPAELIESELFGYAPGAFSGSRAGGLKGKFEQAEEGTIFLDEIGELPMQLQPKLLRVLESGEIQKIGCSESTHADFRLIVATNRDLEKMVSDGDFRSDLFFRMNVLHLNLPPLRDHVEDIPLLIRIFLEEMVGFKMAHQLEASPSVLASFKAYSWPGNVRELKHIIAYATYMLDKDSSYIELKHLPRSFPILKDENSKQQKVGRGLDVILKEAECKAIRASLQRSGGNRSEAARQLGISRNCLYAKMRKFNMS